MIKSRLTSGWHPSVPPRCGWISPSWQGSPCQSSNTRTLSRIPGPWTRTRRTCSSLWVTLTRSNDPCFCYCPDQWATLSVTCPVMATNTQTHAGVYFDWGLHSPSCCPRYSVEHQMWISVKIVLGKWAVSSEELLKHSDNVFSFVFIYEMLQSDFTPTVLLGLLCEEFKLNVKLNEG